MFPAIVSLNNKITQLYIWILWLIWHYIKNIKGFYSTILSKINLFSLSAPSPSTLPRSLVARTNASPSVQRAACNRYLRWRQDEVREREIRDAPLTKTWWSDRRRTSGGSTSRERKRKRENAAEMHGGSHAHTRPAHDSSVGIRRLFPPRGLSSLRRPVSRWAPGLTRTELCHRAALVTRLLFNARENMRQAATYASTTVHVITLWRLNDPESRTESWPAKFYARNRDSWNLWISLN